MRVTDLVTQQVCCKRAFIRGAFLASGSISDPEKGYHLEIVCSEERKADQLQELIRSFDIDAKIVTRKKSYVVYVKEGAQIVEMLGGYGGKCVFDESGKHKDSSRKCETTSTGK